MGAAIGKEADKQGLTGGGQSGGQKSPLDDISSELKKMSENSGGGSPSDGAIKFTQQPQQPGLSSLSMKPKPPASGEDPLKEDDEDKKRTPRLGH